ncbi:hypothetical protein CLOM_g12928 [Closterium sp. NIES-68]|nr:hypothetical protein CLOM_g12928 [Closterium sp. NIES-68]
MAYIRDPTSSAGKKHVVDVDEDVEGGGGGAQEEAGGSLGRAKTKSTESARELGMPFPRSLLEAVDRAAKSMPRRPTKSKNTRTTGGVAVGEYVSRKSWPYRCVNPLAQ